MSEEIPLEIFELSQSNFDNESDHASLRVESFYKRSQRIFYDYLRDHYRTLIYILFSIVLILLVSVIFLIVFGHIREQNLDQIIKSFQGIQVSGSEVHNKNIDDMWLQQIKHDYEARDNKNNNQHVKNKHAKKHDEHDNKIVKSSELTEELDRTYCQKTRCSKSDFCHPTTLDYLSLRSYCCCCLPSYLIFKYFEEIVSVDKISIVFQDTRIDPVKYTSNDLKYMEDLQNLKGVWEVVETGYQVYLLKYTDITLPPSPEPPE